MYEFLKQKFDFKKSYEIRINANALTLLEILKMSFEARFSFIIFRYNSTKLVHDFYLSITLIAFTYRTIKQFKANKIQ